MSSLLDNVQNQLEKSIEMKKKLKVDITGKKAALDIDRDCIGLGNISERIHSHSRAEEDIPSRSSELSWSEHSETLLNNSNQMRTKGRFQKNKKFIEFSIQEWVWE